MKPASTFSGQRSAWSLFELLQAEAADERRVIVAAAILGALANAMILASINAVARSPEEGDFRAFFVFGLLVLLYILCARHTSQRTTTLIEMVLYRIKVRIGEKIVQAELDALERVKAAEICDRITENMTFISDRAGVIALLLPSAFIVASTAMYIAWLSPSAFALVALLCGAGAAMFVLLRREFVQNMQQTAKNRVVFFERLTDLLSGIKETRFSRQRRREIREDILKASDSLRVAGIKSSSLFADNMLLGEGVLFALLTAVVYTLHRYVQLDGKTLASLVAGVMFLWGPFMNLSQGLMPYIRSNMALAEIAALEQQLETAAREGAVRKEADDPWQGRITTIEASEIAYTYADSNGGDSFRVGPISLTLSAGEVVFIVGGNGSGKSTFLKVLTGLYAPSAGALRVNGIAVVPENVASYRDTISAIFTDFHLFPRLYGLAGVEEAEVRRLLARMRIDGQTDFKQGKFTKLTLSTGQKKRLAMVVALLEDRPICVFDEWAADQDPEFRRYFYEELLPLLRQEAKLVIVVSHDDRYFPFADRVITMEEGKIRSIDGRVPPSVAS